MKLIKRDERRGPWLAVLEVAYAENGEYVEVVVENHYAYGEWVVATIRLSPRQVSKLIRALKTRIATKIEREKERG